MKTRASMLVVLVAGMLPAAAQADFAHVVVRGETLSSIAATDGMSVDSLARANSISPDAELIAGQLLQIPPLTEATAASPSTDQTTTYTSDTSTQSTGGSYVVQPGDTLTAIAQRDGTTIAALAAANDLNPNGPLIAGTALSLPGQGTITEETSETSSTQSTGGSYVVQPGDTLTAIAQRDGTTVAALAAANGMRPNSPLIAGTALTLPGTSTSDTATTQYVSSASSSGGPYPTTERVDASQIADVAEQNGVPAPLAEAIGWQESGWNNAEVSSAHAVGVMQIVPSTWSWINHNLTPSDPLAPASATENVRGGVLLLHDLLSLTGGDPAMAAAGYYQGLSSVKAHGMYPDTKQYVANVMALEHRFGG